MSEHEDNQENKRRDFLKSGAVMGGFAMTASTSFMSQTAMAQDEVLIPFTDMPPDFAGPPKQAGGVFFQNTQLIEDFYSRNADQFYVVQHYGQPELNANTHRVQVSWHGRQPYDAKHGGYPPPSKSGNSRRL